MAQPTAPLKLRQSRVRAGVLRVCITMAWTKYRWYRHSAESTNICSQDLQSRTLISANPVLNVCKYPQKIGKLGADQCPYIPGSIVYCECKTRSIDAPLPPAGNDDWQFSERLYQHHLFPITMMTSYVCHRSVPVLFLKVELERLGRSSMVQRRRIFLPRRDPNRNWLWEVRSALDIYPRA